MTSAPRRGRALARSSGIAMAANLVVLGSGVLNFLVLAARLDPEEYGLFGSVQAITFPAMVLATIGAPTLALRRISQGWEHHEAWGRAVAMVAVGGVAATAALVVAKPLLLARAPLGAYALLVLAYGVVSVYPDLVVAYAMAIGSMRVVLIARLVQHGPRASALLVFLLLPDPTLLLWTWLALVTGIASTLATVVLAHRIGGLLPFPKRSLHWWSEAKEGYGFAMNGVSEGVLNASDRPVMYESGFQADAGVYSAAYRLMNLALIPGVSLMNATTSSVFAAGAGGVGPSRDMARRYLRTTVALGLASGAAMAVGAPLARLVVDRDYGNIVVMIRLLAVVPVVKSIQYLAGNALDAAGKPLARFWLTSVFAVLNLGANLILIPRYSWKAAIATTVAAEVSLTVALWVILWRLARRERRSHWKDLVWSI
jgi:O-antigen/teichoic acid export membrane protein